MDEATVALSCGVVIILVFMFVVWKWRRDKSRKTAEAETPVLCPQSAQLVHKLCPHHNVMQSYAVVEKDSLDAHLDLLTKKLAEKEGRLRLSKSKIRETQNEIENLQAIDQNVRIKYRELMENLKMDLLTNEQECMKLHDQIEWVSQRRAELREEVRRGQRLFGAAAEELATNLAELQRGRSPVVGKPAPAPYSNDSLRHRKESVLPRMSVEPTRFKPTPTPSSLGQVPSYDVSAQHRR